MADHVHTPFVPTQQNFTLLMGDGVTPFQVNMVDLDAFMLYNVEICINYGSQIGASLIMLVVVLLVTRKAKRKSLLFPINVLSLILSIIRSLLMTLYWVGPFTETYAYFSGDYTAVPRSAYSNSIACIVVTLILLFTVETSLVLQTHVILRLAMRNRYRYSIMAASILVALLAIGFRFAIMVRNAMAIMSLESTYFLTWLASATLITETISIWYFCLIFVAKLGVTIYQRRMMNQKQWSVLSIVFIMGGCTMVIPSLFAILEYFPDDTFPEAGSLALTLVAIFLPLSSVWAGAAMDGRDPVSHSSTLPKPNSYANRFDAPRDRKGSVGPIMYPSTINSSRSSPENPFKKQSNFRGVDKIELEDIDGITIADARIERPSNSYVGKTTGGFGRD